MTEAVTPPPSPSSASSSSFDWPEPPPEKTTWGDVRDAAAVALLVGVAGVLLGLLWVWLAPKVQYVSNGEAVFLKNTESEARIGADGTFFLLAAGLGLLSAVGVFLWRRRGGVPLVIGLAVGSVFAAVVGWRLGMWLGPTTDLPAAAAKAGKGVPFDAPLQLLAQAVLLVWPLVAVAAHLALTAVFTQPEPPAWPEPAAYPPPHVHATDGDPEPRHP